MNHNSSVVAFVVTLIVVIGVNQLLSAEQPDHDRKCPTTASTGPTINSTPSTAREVGS